MRMKLAVLFLAFCGMVFSGQSQTIQLENSTLEARVLADRLVLPWDLEWGPDGWIWYTTRTGGVYRIHPDDGTIKQVLFIEGVFNSDDNSGLHAISLHPRFPIVPYVYLNYPTSLFDARLVYYTYDLQRDTLINPVDVMDNIKANASHNGSRIVWDEDENLYLAMGDAFTPKFSQDTEHPNGKILRMTGDGQPVEGNPFGNLLWSWGHRNPQGLDFGRNGLLYSSEHGSATDDELNVIEAGRNYGWPDVEGYCDNPSEMGPCLDMNVREPIAIWTPTDAPSGLAYFDHPSIPEWQNSVIQTFLKAKRISVLKLDDSGLQVTEELEYLELAFGRLRDILVTPNGRIFICTSNREPNGNGASTLQPEDDRIFELVNTNYNYVEPELNLADFTDEVFPVPSQDGRVTVRLVDEQTGTYSARIIDATGKDLDRWESLETYTGFLLFDLSHLNPGAYLLELTSPDGNQSVRKIILN